MNYYKKYEKKCCDCCDKGNDVSYYKCSNHKNDCKNCDCYIEKTEDLIEDLECKNEMLGTNLKDAQGNQAAANSAVGGVKDDLDKLSDDLKDIAAAVLAAQSTLADAIDKLGDLADPQQDAIENIDDAIENQECIEDIIGCLEDAFEDTIKCLKKCGSKCPVLVPIEDECDNNNHKHHDCGCHKDKKC